jgi:diguanylate cyclase (GGDEF)-like protein/PAS domain S-box-containing protein
VEPRDERYRLLFERCPLPVWVYDKETLAFVAVNDATVRCYGYSRRELLEMTIRDIRPDADVARLERALAAGQAGRRESEDEWRHLTKRGELIEVEVLTEEVTFAGRRCRLVLAQEITARKRVDAQLEQRAAQQSVVARFGLAALEGANPSGLMQEVVATAAETLGVEFCELLELDSNRETLLLRDGVGWGDGLVRHERVPFGSRFHAGFTFGSLGQIVIEDFAEERRFEPTPLLRRHGVTSGACVIVGTRQRPFGVLGAYTAARRSFSADEVDFLQALANVLADSVDRHEAEEQIRHQAMHDALTGLPNRSLLMERLNHWFGRTSRKASTAAVLFLDVDNFKLINDTLGHEAGDRLLVALAERLQTRLRPSDTVARVGGDEFVILCEDLAQEQGALEVVERFARALSEPFSLAGRMRQVNASIGITVTDESSDPDALIRSADAAMYRAKERGGARYEIFDDGMRERSLRWLETERDLRCAIENRELFNLYQPIVAAAGGEVVGLEALVRWRHPTRGVVAPAQFIPVAEQTGLILPIGRAVMEQACEHAARWQPGPEGDGLQVAVNLSARQIADPQLLADVEQSLDRSGLEPELLSLEITESVLIDDPDLAQQTLLALKQLGVRLVLDDFGIGYSSLAHIKRYPIDVLKIDRSFVAGLGRDHEDAAIVAAVISMGRALGVGVVAEGVETIEQAEQLRALGCPLVQGYLFARPLSVEAAGRLIEQPTRATA